MQIKSEEQLIATSLEGRLAGIETGNSLFATLVSKQYRDPLLAALRELVTNACEAHVMDKNVEQPFEVHVDYDEAAKTLTYSVRDYGCGMSEDFVYESYFRLGKSSKRDSNIVGGAFGIGAKAAFAISQIMIVTCYTGTEAITVTGFLTAEGIAVKKYDTVQDDSQKGTKVSFVIAASDQRDGVAPISSILENWESHGVAEDAEESESESEEDKTPYHMTPNGFHRNNYAHYFTKRLLQTLYPVGHPGSSYNATPKLFFNGVEAKFMSVRTHRDDRFICSASEHGWLAFVSLDMNTQASKLAALYKNAVVLWHNAAYDVSDLVTTEMLGDTLAYSVRKTGYIHVYSTTDDYWDITPDRGTLTLADDNVSQLTEKIKVLRDAAENVYTTKVREEYAKWRQSIAWSLGEHLEQAKERVSNGSYLLPLSTEDGDSNWYVRERKNVKAFGFNFAKEAFETVALEAMSVEELAGFQTRFNMSATSSYCAKTSLNKLIEHFADVERQPIKEKTLRDAVLVRDAIVVVAGSERMLRLLNRQYKKPLQNSTVFWVNTANLAPEAYEALIFEIADTFKICPVSFWLDGTQLNPAGYKEHRRQVRKARLPREKVHKKTQVQHYNGGSWGTSRCMYDLYEDDVKRFAKMQNKEPVTYIGLFGHDLADKDLRERRGELAKDCARPLTINSIVFQLHDMGVKVLIARADGIDAVEAAGIPRFDKFLIDNFNKNWKNHRYFERQAAFRKMQEGSRGQLARLIKKSNKPESVKQAIGLLRKWYAKQTNGGNLAQTNLMRFLRLKFNKREKEAQARTSLEYLNNLASEYYPFSKVLYFASKDLHIKLRKIEKNYPGVIAEKVGTGYVSYDNTFHRLKEFVDLWRGYEEETNVRNRRMQEQQLLALLHR